MINGHSLKRQILWILYVSMLNPAFHLYAQVEDIRFRNISIEQGLSQNSAFCIIQDNKGFIWIGTETGLNRYDGYQFTVYRSEGDNPNSLSNPIILSICKDQHNIFWIGTEKGLNRFDHGKEEFRRYLHDPDNPNSLSNNRVFTICEGGPGELWIGTENGLNKFNQVKNQFTYYKSDADNPKSLSHNIVRSVCQDKSGVLWIGTDGGGLNRFDPEKEQFTCYKNIPDDPTSLSNNHVLYIYEDDSGILWIGTDGGGLNRFDLEKEQFTRYKNIPNNPTSLSDNHVNVIYEDLSGTLWIGTNNGGLNLFEREKNRFTRYENNPYNPHSLSNNRVVSIFEDNTGGLWFGTRGGGVNIYSRETQKFIHYKHSFNKPNSLSNDMIWAIYEDHYGILWIGTDFGGLNKFDREKNEFTHYKHDPNDPNSLSDNSIYTVYEDKSGVLWIGTRAGGLNKFDRKSERFTHYTFDPRDPHSLSNNKVFCIYEDRSNVLWIGTIEGGLNMFDREKERFTRYTFDPDDPHSLSNNKVFCILEDRLNIFWIGTKGGGLNKLDREKGQFVHFKSDTTDSNSLCSDFVLSMYEDRSGILWIGTNNGLNKFNRGKETFTSYTTEDGLPDNVIYDILEDDNGNLWMSTNRGIFKLNPKTEEIKSYDVKDGLQSNEFNTGTAHKSKSGEMFFGGVNGFNSFYPDRIRDNPHIPPVVITDLQLFNKSVPIGKRADGRSILERSITETKEIKLSYSDDAFSFEFAALHYASPDDNQYAYIMEGFEKEWNYVSSGRRYATYTRLSPGKYVFRVKGSNNDGVWNEEGTSLKISIIPPFWKTWWFYTFCTIIIIVSTALIYRYRVSQLKRQKEEEERHRIFVDLNQVLKQGSAAVYRRGFDSKVYEYMGEGIKDITGYSTEEITVDTWDKIIIRIEMSDELKVFSIEEVFDRVRKGVLDRWMFDYQIRAKSGAIKWVRDMATVLRNESGQCYALMGFMFDITDSKLAEQELAQTFIDEKRKRKTIHSTLFEHTADPIFIFDKDTHRFLDCNKAVITNYGYSKTEIRSMTPLDLHPPEDLDKVNKYIDVRNVDAPNVYKHITKDGRQIDVEILSDETIYKGKPAWISIARNITERKQAELKLRQLSEELHLKNQEMETDLNMAREIQTAFLSKQYKHFPFDVIEDRCALQFSHLYLPASTLAGDFFDILPISNHEVGVLICDVMGHGTRASLLTFYIRGLIKELMPVKADTDTFMMKLNEGLLSIMERFYTGIFATAFYCVVDIKSGKIHFTNAGHPMPFILRRSQGIVEKLKCNRKNFDPAIGIHKDYIYTTDEIPIADDDIVLFYTDGLYEVMGKDGKMYGKKRLINSIRNKLTKPPDLILDETLKEINTFAVSKEFEDDICIVAMHVKQASH